MMVSTSSLRAGSTPVAIAVAAEPLGNVVDVTNDQCARTLTGSFRCGVELHTASLLELPLDDFRDRVAPGSEDLLVPPRAPAARSRTARLASALVIVISSDYPPHPADNRRSALA
jgi:hypothetical protein